MTPVFKARYFAFYPLLFISIVCGSFAASGNNQKKTEPYNPQIVESDPPQEILKKVRSAIRGVKSYRIRIETPSISKDVSILEYAFPDRARLLSKSEELIWIGKNIYRKKGDGTWEKYPETKNYISMTDLPATALENLMETLIYPTEDVEFIAREDVDGVPTLVYEHTMRSNAYQHTMRSKTGTFTEKSWIGAADGLLRRWEFECDLFGSRRPPVTVSHTYYDYNAEIKIEPPAEYVSVPELPRGLTFGGPDMGLGYECVYNVRSGMGPGAGAYTKAVDTKPVLLSRPQPLYTEKARENNVQGVVRVLVLIGTDGSVKRASLLSGLAYGLNKEAMRVAYQMRFRPAMRNGQPVEFSEIVSIEFTL